MSMALKAVFERDLALAYRQRSELMQPMMFFILVISLFPLGIGPNLSLIHI